MVSRVRWAVLFALLLFVVAAAPVLASGESSGEVPPGEMPPSGEGFDSPTGKDASIGFDAVELEEREQAEWLLSPEAIQQREASQHAFADVSVGEAQSLLVEAFPRQLQELNADPARVLSELDIEKVLGTYGARISAGDGESAIVESAVPVQSDLGGDGKEPVDLALERSGPAFVPQNPLTEVELPGSAADPIKLHGGIEVGLPTSGDHGAEPLGDKNLFIPETETATDTLIAPIAGGVEVFEQLRSPESPEEFRFPFSIPQGAKLREGAHGAEVLSASGEMLEEVPSPTAVDAQGTDVPVTMSVEGDSLVIGIAHRSTGVAYPLLLDPRYNEGYESPPFSGWVWGATGPYGSGNTPSSLLAYSQGSSVAYSANTFGQWEYNAPGETVYMENASFSPIYFYVNNCQTPQPHGYVGIFNVNSWSYNSLGVYSNGNISGASYFAGGGGVGTRKAIVGISTTTASTLKCAHEMWVGGVTVRENDPEKPTINGVSGVPSGWFNPAKAGSATISATDQGFGLDRISIENVGAGGSSDPGLSCTGMWNSRCPRDRNWTIAPPYKYGERPLKVSAEDPTGKVGEWSTTTKVDASNPEVELSGQLAVITEQTGTEAMKQELGEDVLKLPVYNLHVKATDGNEKVAVEKQAGLKTVDVYLDGVKQKVPWEPVTSCPASSCKIEGDFPLQLAGITSGEHKLKVIATDQVELVREREIDFEYFPATGMKDDYIMQRFPLPDSKVNEEGLEDPKRPELAVNVTNGNLVYHQRDVEVKGPAVNLEVERFYNSQLPKAASTEWGQGWTLAQTPELELEKAAGSPPAKAPMVRTSGVMQSPVGLPTETNQKRFDAKLQALVTKEAGGGYEVADESGDTNTSLAFDSSGKVSELRTPGYAKVDYSYEGGDLSEIAIDDPSSTTTPPPDAHSSSLAPPAYGFFFGASGSGNGQFSTFGGIATDPAGNVYVADTGNHRVEKFDSNGAYVSQFGKEGTGAGQFGTISGIAVGPEGSIYVADSSAKRIEKFDSNGAYVSQFGKEGAGEGQFGNGIGGLAVDGAGNVYASDYAGKRILKFSSSGTYVGQIADPQLTSPHAIAANAAGELWAVDWGDGRVEKFSAGGARIAQFSSAGSGKLSWPQGIAVDGGSGNVWVVDSEHGRVAGFSGSGAYLGQFGTEGQLAEPNWLAIDAKGGFYVSNPITHQVQKWVTQGAPDVKTESAGSVVETSALLHGTVDPTGLDTKYSFEWGPTTAYGHSMPLTAKGAGAGAKDVLVTEKVEGLKPWVLYHFRVAASNAEGTTYGKDEQLTTWGEWSLESPPLPKASTSSSLADVSCTSTVNCVAVGYDSYVDRGLGETWNGTKWTLLSGSAEQSPTSVSCGSGNSCWAVGTKGAEVLVEHWESYEAGAWERYASTKPVVPEGATNLHLSAIACTTATECTAVGYYTKEGQNQPVAERLAANKWTVQTMPQVAGATLTDLACSSASSCLATGFKVPKGSPSEALSMRWNGTEWSTLTAPAPKAEGWVSRRLTSISCGSATSCKATGASTNEEGEGTPYALSYNGSEWSLATLPSLKVGGSLASMSCTSATACLAVGHAAEGGTLAVGWDGSAWTLRSSLTPKEKTAWLAGVSCVGSLSCTTVGKSVGGGETTPLAERVGEIWTLESPPSPKTSNSSGLTDVSCTSALSCVAVGSDSYATRGLGEVWNGEKWTLVSGTDNSSPASVSCGSPTSCWAVGTQSPENAIFVEHWESEEGSWYRGASTKPVVPEGATSSRLSGISCTTATECTSVGYYVKEGQNRVLAERLAASKWTVQGTAEVAGAVLTDVSCNSATSCVAVGYKTAKGVAPESFSERWNGTEWSTLTVPAPKSEGWTERRLTSISCASATSCVAVGYSANEEAERLPLAVTYDGSAWSLSTLPTAKVGSSLASVSCAAAGNCLAVGHAAEGGTLAVGWSGTEWTLRSSPTPKGKTAWLYGVSCLAPMTCTSVGQSTLSGETAPLAVRVELRNQEATTGSATSVKPSAATLNATVNPHGLSTKYSFEYGPTTAYGTAVPAPSKEAGAGIKDVAVSNAISGLDAGRLYHYRLVATSEVGTTYGQDKTLTTPPPSFAFAFGSQGSGEGQFSSPAGVATDTEGNAYVADAGNHRVVKFNSRGGFVSQFGKEGSGEAQLATISAIAVGPEGYLYVADSAQRKIKRFKANGEFVSQFGAEGTGNGQFGTLIGGLAVDKAGVVWTSDSANHRVERFDSTGKYLSKFGTEGTGNGQFAQPCAIAIDGGGNAWVVDLGHERVEQFSPAGGYQRQFGKAGKGAGELSGPAGLATDAGNNVWVVDSANNRLEEWNSKGEYLSQFGEAGTGESQFSNPSGLAIDPQGGFLIADAQSRIQKWFVLPHDAPSESSFMTDDDPSVEIATPGGLVESIEGDAVDEVTYAHKGQMLTAVDSAAGETKYEYDSTERMTKVTLPNGTWGKIDYEALGRVKSVAVSIEGTKEKKTFFSYQDEPSRRTTVTPESEPITTYDIGADGSVLKWRNATKPPEIEPLSGTLWTERGEVHPEPMSIGDKTLFVPAYSVEGIASIQIVANGSRVVAEKTCKQDLEIKGTECVKESKELVTNTESWPPGILQLEVIVTDREGQVASLRFWVNVPYTPPPGSEAPAPPKFAEVLRFREEFGLDLDLKGNEFAINERIFELISLWKNPNSPEGEVARSSDERWGVPMRPADVVAMEYREAYIAHDGEAIEAWSEEHVPGDYAGYYVDNPSGGVIHVGFTHNAGSDLASLKQQVTLIEPNRIVEYSAPPTASILSLRETMDNVMNAWSSNGTLETLVHSVDINQQAGLVEVRASGPSQVDSILRGSLGSQAPFRVEGSTNELILRGGRVKAGEHIRAEKIIGPFELELRNCTAGPGAYERLGKKANGEVVRAEFLLTAGHCFGMGEDVTKSVYPRGTNNFNKIGAVARTAYPGQQHYEEDAEAIRLEGYSAPQYIYRAGRSPLPIQEVGWIRPGETLCFSGLTSGVVKCGSAVGVRAVALDGQHGRELGIRFKQHSLDGDSGSPVWDAKTREVVGILGGELEGDVIAAPLLRPHGFSMEKAPGVLNVLDAQGGGEFRIERAG